MSYFLYGFLIAPSLWLSIIAVNSVFYNKYEIIKKYDTRGEYYIPVKYFIPVFKVGIRYSERVDALCDNKILQLKAFCRFTCAYTRSKEASMKYIEEHAKYTAMRKTKSQLYIKYQKRN